MTINTAESPALLTPASMSSITGNTGAVRRQVRAFAKQHRHRPARDIIDLAIQLVPMSRPGRHIAYELLYARKHIGRELTKADVLALGEGIADWASVDCFCCFLAGPAWRGGSITDAEVCRWAKSKDRWWRRAAAVATVPLNNRARGATAPKGDPARTLEICEMLVGDRDDMVVKAVSWALRELSKRDSASVKQFLRAHGQRIAPRVRREVESKLRTGLKNPRGSGSSPVNARPR